MVGQSNYKPLNVVNDKEQCPLFLWNYEYISMMQQVFPKRFYNSLLKYILSGCTQSMMGVPVLLLWQHHNSVVFAGEFLLLFP